MRVELENMWNTELIEAVETPQVCTAMIKVPSKPIQAEIKKRGLQLADFPLQGADEQELQVLIGADYNWQAAQKVTNSLVAVENEQSSFRSVTQPIPARCHHKKTSQTVWSRATKGSTDTQWLFVWR